MGCFIKIDQGSPSKFQKNTDRKTLPMFLKFDNAKKSFRPQVLFINWVRNYLFLKNYLTLDGANSHNVSYYQQLPIARYQFSFHANSYFE